MPLGNEYEDCRVTRGSKKQHSSQKLGNREVCTLTNDEVGGNKNIEVDSNGECNAAHRLYTGPPDSKKARKTIVTEQGTDDKIVMESVLDTANVCCLLIPLRALWISTCRAKQEDVAYQSYHRLPNRFVLRWNRYI